MGETVREAVKKFNREHPKGFFGKLMKSTRESAETRAKERAETRALEREAYRKAFQKARVQRAIREGKEAGGRRWTDSLQSLDFSMPSMSYGKKGKKKKKGRSSGGFDMLDNWGYLDE